MKDIKIHDLKDSNNESIKKQISVSPSKYKTVFYPVYESKYENINGDFKNSAQIYEEVNEETKNKKYDQLYEPIAESIQKLNH